MADEAIGAGEDLVSIGEAGAAPAGGMDPRGWGVVAGDGTWLGSVSDVMLERATGTPRYLTVALEPSIARQPGGRRVFVAAGEARLDPAATRVHLDTIEGTQAHLLPERPADAPSLPTPLDLAEAADAAATRAPAVPPPPSVAPAAEGEVRMQLSEEELEIAKRVVSAGEVRVHKHVQTERVREVVPVMREDVTVERRPLPDGAGLEPRQEGDTWYVPIVEEELVIQKRLVAREELVIRKRQVVVEQVIEETLRRETPEVLAPDATPLDDRPIV
ncbi:PRC and DUF2382 domain-containing protein [Longimicrobium sp.]|uniref:PRC and DUF2382 domain-containing protein n=1 Tax=Longimicrobium sp. TaxID=2029185 RepID=UPI002E35B60B|nr:PRC and DUF2382 domain-containing protein [Longimicrobium sp.]HEX6042684.1 PRC and DUF2382 domain-containing protein [Longimicrobium sp.]